MGLAYKTIGNGLCSLLVLTVVGCAAAPEETAKEPAKEAKPTEVETASKPAAKEAPKAENHDEAAPKKTQLAVVKPSMKFSTWLKGVKAEARKKGVKEDILDRAFVNVAPIPRIIELDRHQPEVSMTFQQYLDRVVPKSRVQKGQKKYGANRAALETVGKK